VNDWTEIKELVEQHKPNHAVEEHQVIVNASIGALHDLPVRFEPIYNLVMRVQNESYISNAKRAELNRRGVPIFDGKK